MLSVWWRSRQVRALCRNLPGTNSPAGQPWPEPAAPGAAAAGPASSAGSVPRKWVSMAAAPAGSREAVSSTMIRACCQERSPACSAARVRGRVVVSSRACPSSAAADRSETVRTHATSAMTDISCAVHSRGEAAGPASAVEHSANPAARCTFRAASMASARADAASPSRHASAWSRKGSAPSWCGLVSPRRTYSASPAADAIRASTAARTPTGPGPATPVPAIPALSIPPSSRQAPTKTGDQKPYVDNPESHRRGQRNPYGKRAPVSSSNAEYAVPRRSPAGCAARSVVWAGEDQLLRHD